MFIQRRPRGSKDEEDFMGLFHRSEDPLWYESTRSSGEAMRELLQKGQEQAFLAPAPEEGGFPLLLPSP